MRRPWLDPPHSYETFASVPSAPSPPGPPPPLAVPSSWRGWGRTCLGRPISILKGADCRLLGSLSVGREAGTTDGPSPRRVWRDLSLSGPSTRRVRGVTNLHLLWARDRPRLRRRGRTGGAYRRWMAPVDELQSVTRPLEWWSVGSRSVQPPLLGGTPRPTFGLCGGPNPARDVRTT